MRRKTFFSHLLDTDQLITMVERLLEIEEEKLEILDMIDSTLHHRVVDKILHELDQGHHETFMSEYSRDPGNEELLFFLQKHIPNIEEKIQSESKDAQASLFEDIKKLES
ncbi:hypothetical protein ACFL14_02355 [Patescibacteria group bacterium]